MGEHSEILFSQGKKLSFCKKVKIGQQEKFLLIVSLAKNHKKLKLANFHSDTFLKAGPLSQWDDILKVSTKCFAFLMHLNCHQHFAHVDGFIQFHRKV